MKPLESNNFCLELEKRVKNTINDYELINDGDKVAVALSGGKDSVLVLHINQLEKMHLNLV